MGPRSEGKGRAGRSSQNRGAAAMERLRLALFEEWEGRVGSLLGRLLTYLNRTPVSRLTTVLQHSQSCLSAQAARHLLHKQGPAPPPCLPVICSLLRCHVENPPVGPTSCLARSIPLTTTTLLFLCSHCYRFTSFEISRPLLRLS